MLTQWLEILGRKGMEGWLQNLLISKVHAAFKNDSKLTRLWHWAQTEKRYARVRWEWRCMPVISALGIEVGGEFEASLGWEWWFSTSPVDFLHFVFIYPFCYLWDRILLCSLGLPWMCIDPPASASTGVPRLQACTPALGLFDSLNRYTYDSDF